MSDQNTTPRLDELISFGVAQGLADTHTAMPATVVAYNPTTQLADVQPTTRIHDADGVPRQLPVLTECPVAFPTGGGYAITWPLVPGDAVLVVVASHELDAWLTAGTPDTVPITRRRHDLSDGVVIPGIRPKTQPRTATGAGGLSMGLDAGTSEVRVQAAEVVVTAPTVKLGSVAAVSAVSLSTIVDPYLTQIDTQMKALGLPGLTPIPIMTGAAKVKAE